MLKVRAACNKRDDNVNLCHTKLRKNKQLHLLLSIFEAQHTLCNRLSSSSHLNPQNHESKFITLVYTRKQKHNHLKIHSVGLHRPIGQK